MGQNIDVEFWGEFPDRKQMFFFGIYLSFDVISVSTAQKLEQVCVISVVLDVAVIVICT